MPPKTRPLRKTALEPGTETGTTDGVTAGDAATGVAATGVAATGVVATGVSAATHAPSKMKIWMLKRTVVALGALMVVSLMEALVSLWALMLVPSATDVPSKTRPLRRATGTTGTVATPGLTTGTVATTGAGTTGTTGAPFAPPPGVSADGIRY